jgi:biopolymer transport protein ExbB
MKLLTKLTAACLAATLMFSAVPTTANAQGISSVQSLLDKVRNDAAKTRQENAQREAEFSQRKNEQSRRLSAARGELAQLERKANQVRSSFDGNRARIDRLKAELSDAQGDFREVFGLARSKAGEFKATLDTSMVSAEFPGRTDVLGRVAETDALPDTRELNAIWTVMLEEIKAQREVKSFDAPIANKNDGASQSVTRIGPFAAFTSDGGEFLNFRPNQDIPFVNLEKQPPATVVSAAKAVINAQPGDVVFAPVDPTRGSIISSFRRFKTWNERRADGGFIGAIIWWGFIIGGVIIGLLLLVRLFLIWMSVKGQKRKAQASKSNALGRVMMAYDGAKGQDAETVELKLDEAILKESPKLEFGLGILKLGAGIAPLLGLLGTVTGMIKTFQAMMVYGVGDPQQMAGGISEALVTTMLGLIAAIPLLILHSLCSSLARGVQATLEEQSAGIVARHVESRGRGV